MSYHNPTDLPSALELIAQGDGKVVAGGTDVYPSAQPGSAPDFYLDVTRIAGLSGISEEADGHIRIGAATTWSALVAAPLPPAFDALKHAALEVGSVQIQNAGTIAGNLCNASPAADGVPPLLILDAQVELASAARGYRLLPLAEFIKGVRLTGLAPDELVTGILVPPQPYPVGTAFEKLGSRRYLVISITMVAALIGLDARGHIAEARVAVGAASPVAQRLVGLERRLLGTNPAKLVIGGGDLARLSPIDDVRGPADYRLEAVAEQCARAIRRAARIDRAAHE